jgi:hypothetical protein
MLRLAYPLSALALVLGSIAGCQEPADGDGDGIPDIACEPPLGEQVADEGWDHVPAGQAVDYAHNPPASGPHWNAWGEYALFEAGLPRENWVHNLEHGAVVLLWGPSATEEASQAMKDAFATAGDDPGCDQAGQRRVLATFDAELDSAVAVVAAWAVYEAESIPVDEALSFVDACRGHAPEEVCSDGSVAP